MQDRLPLIVEAGDGAALVLGARERWQEQRGEDRDDGDDHQQFDEREPIRARSDL